MRKLLDWFERETGLISAWGRFWTQPLPPGVGWGHIFGALTLLTLVVLFLTGGALMFYYSPTPDQAYASVQYIEHYLPAGRFIRALHYWAARLIVPLIIIHILRVFFWGAYKRPRQMIWVTGVLLLLTVIGYGLTGYALPWDQKAYWGTVVRLKIAEGVPLVGEAVATFLRGGDTVGAVTLMRFFVLHVFVLSVLVFLLVAWHVLQVRRMGVTPPGVRVNEEASVEKTQSLYPEHTARIAVGAVILSALMIWLSLSFPAPLEPRANPMDTAYKPHPDFYVLWMHELVDFFPPNLEFVGSFVLPTLLVVLLLIVPFIERNPERQPRKRLLALSTGTLILLAIVALNVKGMEALPEPERLSPLEKRGQQVFVELKCYSCHGINGGGGPVGPDLGLGGKRDPEAVRNLLRNPSAHNPHTIMPAYHLSPEKEAALVAYIVSIGPNSKMPPIPPTEPEKPASHFEENWFVNHKFEVRKDPGSCADCHKPFFCQACHQNRRPSSHDAQWLKFHFGNAAERPEMCAACHSPDYCESCHKVMRHDTQWIQQHGSRLAQFGEKLKWAGQTMHQMCYQCHTPQSCQGCHSGALPASHKVANFLRDPRVGHGKLALKQGAASCNSCHQPQFCQSCHGLPMPHPEGWDSNHPQVGHKNPALCQRCHNFQEETCQTCHQAPPSSHTEDFRKEHPRRITDSGASCQVCHGRNACLNCHKTPMPHPQNWGETHGKLGQQRGWKGYEGVKKLQKAQCATCHDIKYCNQCHQP
ncbi:MAG: cytochrome b N-terminal domain-containing protein [Armatimonadota bacterium]